MIKNYLLVGVAVLGVGCEETREIVHARDGLARRQRDRHPPVADLERVLTIGQDFVAEAQPNRAGLHLTLVVFRATDRDHPPRGSQTIDRGVAVAQPAAPRERGLGVVAGVRHRRLRADVDERPATDAHVRAHLRSHRRRRLR